MHLWSWKQAAIWNPEWITSAARFTDIAVFAKPWKNFRTEDVFCVANAAHEHDHHLVPRSKGGSDTIANMAGLCEHCHTLVHTDQTAAEKLETIKAGQNKTYGVLSVLNQIIPYLVEALSKKFNGNIRLVSGWETKQFRDENYIDKDHGIDAYCIAVIGQHPKKIDVPETHFQIRQFRRHDRARIKSQTERTYRLDGEKVAINRRKQLEQKTDSLEDWYQKMAAYYGRQQADRMRSKLQVQRSTRRYNNPNRAAAGNSFCISGKGIHHDRSADRRTVFQGRRM